MTMAAEHERWIEEITGRVPAAERARLYSLLGHLKTVIRDDAHRSAKAIPEAWMSMNISCSRCAIIARGIFAGTRAPTAASRRSRSTGRRRRIR